MADIMKLNSMARSMRLKALEMAYKSGNNGAHLGGGLSAIEIFAVLYGSVLRYNIKSPNIEDRDRLIISKGHCVLAYYTALKEAKFLTEEALDSFETNGSPFHGHATRMVQCGIDFSGGSLSMGFSFAVGVALACKKKRINNHIFSLVGDGECDEGLIWEAAMSASNYNLNNLTLIVDCNKLQYDGPTKEIMNSDSLAEKFKSFGFETIEIDGHDCSQLYDSFTFKSNKPICVIANTIKGKGVSFMEGDKKWHHSTLNKEQYETALNELKE